VLYGINSPGFVRTGYVPVQQHAHERHHPADRMTSRPPARRDFRAGFDMNVDSFVAWPGACRTYLPGGVPIRRRRVA
jgi:hypothetical protein